MGSREQTDRERANHEQTGRHAGKKKPSRKVRGDRGEAAAARFLEERGYVILARQWKCRFGELDLVALDPRNVICFVEVKLRGPGTIAAPREFVDGRKQARLRAAAELWLSINAPDAPARFDVAEVAEDGRGVLSVTYWEDAFQ